jgi:3-phosphoshikimate 1-carboxyvinyltransferase
LGISGMLTGLRTLRIKETDRLAAMQTELARVKTTLEIIPKADDLTCTIHGKARWKDKARFDTYDDHRMAMALAQLSCIKPVIIHEPNVVSKSYPGFWQDAKKLGMRIEEQRGSR